MEIFTTDLEQQNYFKTKNDCLEYLLLRTMNLKKCFRFIKRETGHLFIKCPVVNDMIAITGKEEEVSFIYNQLVKRDLFRPGELTGW
jgi:hypothetical protein